MKDYKSEPLVDQKLALSLFLEDLLREPEPVEAPVSEAPAAPEAVPVAPRPAAAVPPTPAAPETTVSTQPPGVAATSATQAAPAPGGQEERPAWAQQPFQIMLFKVAGLTLAVPLETLSGVVEWPARLSEMPGHADFYLGILQHLGNKVPVVDTARLTFPPDRLAELESRAPAERCRRIVLINGGRWGLACDAVEEVITLTPEQVRWRSGRTRRRWLLGTVIEHMCALLDTDAFAEKLASGSE